jgi:hypothetical protein
MPKPVFENQARREGLLFGVYTGFYLLLIGLHALFWRLTRARESRLFLAYIGICVSNEVLFTGVIQQMAGLSATVSSGLVGLCIAIALPVGAAMFLRQLGAERLYPRPTRWVIRLFAAYGLVCAALILSGHFALGMRPMQILGLALILTTTVLALRLAWRGWRLAYHFLLIFSPFYAGVVISFLRNLGIVPVNGLTQYASVIGTMIHLLLLNLLIIARHEHRRRRREARQAALAAELAMQRTPQPHAVLLHDRAIQPVKDAQPRDVVGAGARRNHHRHRITRHDAHQHEHDQAHAQQRERDLPGVAQAVHHQWPAGFRL